MAPEDFCRKHGVERIVFLPNVVHVHLHRGWLGEHIGRGKTIEEATHDAIARVEKVAA